jgi:arylsulfatase A-like enzyme
MDPHPPFPTPSNPEGSDLSDWDLYQAEVRVNDAQLERLYGLLTELDLKTKTLFVVTSDHGRAFGEHGASGHGTSVHEEEVRVPLILVHEKMIPPARLLGPASLLDILPSILDHCSIPYEASQFDGLSLFRSTPDQRRDRPLLLTRFLYPDDTEFSHYNELEFLGWIERGWKLILRVGENAEQQLYDLREDPAERINLLSSQPEQAAVLRRHLTDFLVVLNRRRSALLLDLGANADITSQVPDPATLKRLRSLGYLR